MLANSYITDANCTISSLTEISTASQVDTRTCSGLLRTGVIVQLFSTPSNCRC